MSSMHYDKVAITLHWLMAACIIGMLVLGFFMEDITPASLRFQAYDFHKALGITLLFLSFLRLFWRLTHKAPPLPAAMKPVEKLAARGAHWALYALMIGMPFSGWVMSSAAAKYKITFFGLFQVPFLPVPDAARKTVGGFAHEAHELLAYGLIALLVLHLLAALKHHFINRDDVLSHMLPFVKRG
jgi:cytochrome b561